MHSHERLLVLFVFVYRCVVTKNFRTAKAHIIKLFFIRRRLKLKTNDAVSLEI